MITNIVFSLSRKKQDEARVKRGERGKEERRRNKKEREPTTLNRPKDAIFFRTDKWTHVNDYT